MSETYIDNELAALKDFRHRISSVQLDWFYGHNYYLIRWLRARNMDVDKAYDMFMKHQEWRTRLGIDEILKKPLPESIVREYPMQVPGLDDDDNLVTVIPFGQWNIRGLVERGDKDQLLNFINYNLEFACHLARSRSTVDKMAAKLTIILDMDGFSVRTVLHKPTVDFLLEIVKNVEDNYPEFLKAGYLINSPKIFEILWAIAKPMLTERTLSKYQIMGCNSNVWRAKLLNNIPPGCLPSKYGGAQTTVPNASFYYAQISRMNLSKEEFNLKLETHQSYPEDQLVKVVIEGNNKFQHVARIPAKGGILRWAFKTDDHDVGFRLFNATGDKVIEVNRADAHKSTQVGTFKCSASGSYVFSFDNSYSRVSKNLYYKIELCEPEEKKK